MLMNLTTIEKSKAVMPLITRICADLNLKWREAFAMRKEAEANINTMTLIQKADYESDIDELIDMAKSYIYEIEELGGIIYNFEPVTIHFPVLCRCQEFVLCYILGEDNTLNKCHLINHECKHRQPIESIGNLDAPV